MPHSAARCGDQEYVLTQEFSHDLPAYLQRKGQGEHAVATALKVCGKVTSARHPGISLLAGIKAGRSKAATVYS